MAGKEGGRGGREEREGWRGGSFILFLFEENCIMYKWREKIMYNLVGFQTNIFKIPAHFLFLIFILDIHDTHFLCLIFILDIQDKHFLFLISILLDIQDTLPILDLYSTRYSRQTLPIHDILLDIQDKHFLFLIFILDIQDTHFLYLIYILLDIQDIHFLFLIFILLDMEDTRFLFLILQFKILCSEKSRKFYIPDMKRNKS